MAITFGNTGWFGASSASISNDGDFLIVGVTTTSNNITAATFNGVSMTQIGATQNNIVSARWIMMFGLANPATGSNTLAFTGGANHDVRWCSISGVDQTTPFTGATANGGTSSTPSVAVTTTVDNAYAVAFSLIRNFSSVGANTTVLNGLNDPNVSFYRSTNPVSPAGAFTINVNSTGSEWDFIAAGINPVVTASSATYTPQLMTLKVG